MQQAGAYVGDELIDCALGGLTAGALAVVDDDERGLAKP
jgi:hypothetical protein